MTRPKLLFLIVWMFLAHNVYAWANSTPEQLDGFLRRVLVMENKKGPEAIALKRRYGTQDVKPYDVWDCDDRAAYAARYAKSCGYEARAMVQRAASGVLHRYVEVSIGNIRAALLKA